MVKLGRAKEQNRAASAPTSTTGLICYICGASNADWPVHSRIRSPPNSPFFPFLDYHDPPPGCRPMDRRTGRVDACTVCFSFLTQQWHTYEANDTPLIKRLYWLKRSGMDPSSEKKETPQAGNKAVSAEELDKALRNLDEERNLEASSDKSDESEIHGDEKCDSSSVVQDGHAAKSSCTSTEVAQKPVACETCFICGREKAKEFVRSVHTRAQLKTETPFYPCLARHTPVSTARKIDYLGKAVVCEACQKFLFRQWQVFQKNNTPLGERQYQLRSDPSLPREQQSQLSTMVCFICGVNQPATSGRFLYSQRHASGEPYYPFLGKLTPLPGAMPLTQQGLTRVCSGCRKSLHRQWKCYDTEGVDEEDRQYRIRNETAVHVHDKGSSLSEVSAVACYTCGRSCPECDMCHLYTKPNTNPSSVTLFFPFIANLKPPADAIILDQTGRAVVCKECHGCLEQKWFTYEKENTPIEDRMYDLRLRKKQAQVSCFLCGTKDKAHQVLLLYSYPQSGEGVEDGGPFFPFLSTREPASNAQAIDPQGAVATCEICFVNLMTQWQMYESSSVPEENNRWLRKYHVSHVVCYLCGKRAHRNTSDAVNKLLITFSKNHQPPRGALSLDRDRVVLCPDCQGAVKSDLEAMEDRNQTGQAANKLKGFAKDELLPADPVIVIDSSDSENEPFSRLRAKQSPLSVSASHDNELPMHYTTSASPGVHQPLLQNKDHITSVSPTSSMRSSSNRHSEASFAAALRSLAKHAVTPLSHSPVSSNSGSQSPSPAVSAPTSRNTGMSPSRSSPAARSTPPFLDSKSKDKREVQHQVAGRVCSPSAAPNTKFEPEHRNQTPGDPAHDPSRGSLGPEMGLHRVGHQVMPGVYSTKPHSGAPREVAMLSECYPPNHPPPHMAYYMHHGGKPEVPVLVPRGVPGPPPLLASKRDGLEHSAVVRPFYPGPYRPPHVLDPNDIAFPTWRQQRASEHLRQQHDRQVHFGDGYPEPFDRQVPHSMEPDRHIPLSSIERHGPPSTVEHHTPRNESLRQRTEDASENESRKQEGPKGASSSDNKSLEAGGKEPGNEKASRGEKSDSMPMIRQVYYYNDSKTSCPVHGHSTGPSRTSPTEPTRSHPSHGPPPGSDPLPAPKPGRPDEYNRMFLPPLEAPMLHPYLVHHPRDAPYSVHPLDKRQADYFREQGRQQELYFHQHALRDQNEQRKAREEDWHHQQQLAQEKEAAGRDPRERGRYSHHMHRQELEHRERTRRSPFNVDPHKTDSPLERQNHRDREFYRAYPLQPFYPPHVQDGSPAKSFGDHYPRGVEPHVLRAEGRHVLKPPHGMQFPVGRFPAGYQDPYPFFPDGFQPATSIADRSYGGAGVWHRRERASILNGDYPLDVPRSQVHRGDPSDITRRIKVERTEDDSSTRRPVLKIRHSPSKLRFLEGLGLVTVDKKQELSRGEPGRKRSYDDNHVIDNDKEGVENKENESPLDLRTDNDSSTTDSDTAQSRAEKLEFMALLGLVPPSQRQELEKCYEVKRSERKTRKARGRPPKRARRDGEADRDSDNSQGSNVDLENATGPMTRQKQQQLQEQGGLQEQRKSKESRMDIGKELSVHVKTESTDKPSSPFSFEQRDSYRGNNTDQYRNSPTVTSSERHSSHIPPRLTLQSLTNMEDPFSNLSASTFRPPYLRHTGLLSISQDLAPPTHHEPRSVSQPVRPEPLRSTGLAMSEKLSRDYLSQRPPTMGLEFGRQFAPQGHAQQRPGSLRSDDEQTSREHMETERLSPHGEGFQWPGVESVMQAYLAHAAERNMEVHVLRDNAEHLQLQHKSLNEEAQRLTSHIQNLAHAKNDQVEDSKTLIERLHGLHYFIEGFQR